MKPFVNVQYLHCTVTTKSHCSIATITSYYNDNTSCGAKTQQTPPPCCASRHRAVSRNWPKIESGRHMVTPHHRWKFHANQSSLFALILLTKKQRNKQRNRSKTIPHLRYYRGRGNNNTWTIFMVLSSYFEHCESSPGSRGDRRNSASGRQPLDQANRPEPEDRPCRQPLNYSHRRHLLLLSPKADTHFTVPRRVEGWVDLGGWFTYPDGLPVHRQSPIRVVTWPSVY